MPQLSMTRSTACLLAGAALALGALSLGAQSHPLPAWAYPLPEPGAPAPPPDDSVPRHVPRSTAAFVIGQTRDRFFVPDWHPDGHPPMPPSVASGRRPNAFACGFCHLPNGQGRPENASLAGLPAAYIVRQVADFRDGRRHSAEPRMGPPLNMIVVARNADEAAVREAAAYFAGLRPKRWIRVVETDSVPVTHVGGAMLVPTEGAGREAIGQRIIEVPEDVPRTELRDAASGFVAFVPLGSVKRGRALVARSSAQVQSCVKCHGPTLRGIGEVPRLAGRSPSYLVRQLYDFQSGARAGALSEPMRQVAARLSPDEIVAVVAYLASRAP